MDIAHGGVGQGNGGDYTLHIPRHQDHISRFNGNIRTGANGNPHVGHGQRGCVVNPVTDIGQMLMGFSQSLDSLDLAFRHDFRHHFINIQAAGNGIGRVAVVTGNHHHLDTTGMQLLNGARGGFLDRISHGQQGNNLLVASGIHGRLAFLGQRLSSLRKGRQVCT